MTTTIEYLDAIKSKTGVNSDYALHKLLNTSKTTISNYRNGHNYFDDEMCLKVASILEIPAYEVLLNVHAERSTSLVAKTSFREVLKQLTATAAMCLLTAGTIALKPAPAIASELSSVQKQYTLCEQKRTKLRHLSEGEKQSLFALDMS